MPFKDRPQEFPKKATTATRSGGLPCRRQSPDLRILMVGDTGIEPVTSSVSRKRAPAAPIALGVALTRWRRDLNPCTRLCRPLPRLSATPPWCALRLSERMTRLELATLTLAR
jgi:hypothetical protein